MAQVEQAALGKRVGLAVAAPLIALVVSVLVTSVVLEVSGSSAGTFWSAMFANPGSQVWVNVINQTAITYLAAVAAAIGFRMNLFNIGLEGQYTVASFAAATFAGAAFLTGWTNVVASLVVAVVVGALWAGIAGLLLVTRGVSEVISTIMLNAIATTAVGYLLNQHGVHKGNSVQTKAIPGSSELKGFLPWGEAAGPIWTLSLLAVVVGVGFWFMLTWTRFGFDLRASGMSISAARSSGINSKRMILVAMLLSGGVAGLIWMPALFGGAGSYGDAFQSGLGFTGVSVALLGRNRPLGMAFGAVLFSYLSAQSNTLTLTSDISPSIVQITQGIAVLAVVIAYELVRRWRVRLEQRDVAGQVALGATA